MSGIANLAKHSHKPLHLLPQDVHEVGGMGSTPMRCVETGIFKPEMVAAFGPSRLIIRVKLVMRN